MIEEEKDVKKAIAFIGETDILKVRFCFLVFYFKGRISESHGHNLALSILCLPKLPYGVALQGYLSHKKTPPPPQDLHRAL